jgi:pimeloyl-ACP methyl ester carboxylesterase
MNMTRRAFTGGALMTLFSPAISSAEGRLKIIPESDLAIRDDIYAVMARSGPFHAPSKPVHMLLGEDKVPCLVYVADDVERARLVVFSHGALQEPQVYSKMLNFLATHGYCVVAPIHSDSLIKEGLQVQEGREIWEFGTALNDPRLWLQRAASCQVARNEFAAISNTMEVIIDATYPIIMGHSFGAFTAQMLLGARVNSDEGPIQMENDGWAGAILLGPQGAGVLGLDDSSWQQVTSPMMIVTSPDEIDITQQDPARKLDPYFLSAPNYKHIAYLSKAGSNIYNGQSARPGSEELYIFRDLRGSVNLFLSAYGKRQEKPFNSLYEDEFARRAYGYVAIGSR